MVRNLLIIVFCVGLSFMLLSVGTFVLLKTTTMGKFVEEYSQTNNLTYEQIMKKYGDPLDLTITAVLYTKIILIPLIAIFVGAFIGFFSKGKIWLISFISFLPLPLVYLYASSWGIEEIALSIAYVLLVGITANFIFIWRSGREQAKV